MLENRYTGSYQAVKRFVQKLRGPRRPEAAGIILTAPGEEAQVDYGSGPMVRDAGFFWKSVMGQATKGGVASTV